MKSNRRIPFLKTKTTAKFYWLFLVWILGLAFGYCHGLRSGDMLSACFSAAGRLRISAVAHAASVLLPFALSALAAFFIPFALFPLAFLKAFIYGLTIACVRSAYGSAGWLMLPLLVFAESISVPVYLWFWSSLLEQGRSALCKKMFITISALFVICAFDCCVISPFLFRVLSYI